jgi:DNA-binding GntR family transcriptional regulator
MELDAHRDARVTELKADEHHALMESVITGDSDTAATVMREHIDTAWAPRAAWPLIKP